MNPDSFNFRDLFQGTLQNSLNQLCIPDLLSKNGILILFN